MAQTKAVAAATKIDLAVLASDSKDASGFKQPAIESIKSGTC